MKYSEDDLYELFGDLSYLVDQELVQVCVGQYQLQLCFHNELRISIESELRIIGADGASEGSWRNDSEFKMTELFRFLGKRVVEFEVLENARLQLVFEEAGSLVIEVDDRLSESYEISYNGDLPIIV